MEPSAFTGISFIVCHRKDEDLSTTLASIEKSFLVLSLPCPHEVISVQGNHPTLQRNAAVSYARYSHIYFLDNDSEVGSNTIKHLVEVLSHDSQKPHPHSSAEIIGGPSLLYQNANHFEQCVDGLLSCKWAVGRRNARYSQSGTARKTDTRELILCNMIFRKDFFIMLGGFNIRLYPNEENEIIVRALEQGAGVYYDPELVVYRGQRKDFQAFVRQMLTYGRGRGEELRIWLQRKPNRAWRTWWFGYKIFSVLALLIVMVVFTATIISTVENQFSLNIAKSLPQTNLFTTSSLIFASVAEVAKQLGFWYLIYLAWIWAKVCVTKRMFLYHLPLLVLSCHIFYLYGFFKASWLGKFAVDSKRLWFWFSGNSKV